MPPTPMVTLVHPDRPDTITVSEAASKVHRRAGWMTEAEAAALAGLDELSEQERAALAELAAATPEPAPTNPAIVPGTDTPTDDQPTPTPKPSGRSRRTTTSEED